MIISFSFYGWTAASIAYPYFAVLASCLYLTHDGNKLFNLVSDADVTIITMAFAYSASVLVFVSVKQ